MAENKSESFSPEFFIQRIYTKDLSFEAPGTPQIFQEEWKPAVDMELNTQSSDLGEGNYEVVLAITITTKINNKVTFLTEVHQAGIFMLKGFEKEQLGEMLGSYCPNILFPYAREVLTDIVVRGGFPPLYLAPVNFDALYHERQRAQNKKDEEKSSGSKAAQETH